MADSLSQTVDALSERPLQNLVIIDSSTTQIYIHANIIKHCILTQAFILNHLWLLHQPMHTLQHRAAHIIQIHFFILSWMHSSWNLQVWKQYICELSISRTILFPLGTCRFNLVTLQPVARVRASLKFYFKMWPFDPKKRFQMMKQSLNMHDNICVWRALLHNYCYFLTNRLMSTVATHFHSLFTYWLINLHFERDQPLYKFFFY